jgi:sugar lactone lactonase YvrE
MKDMRTAWVVLGALVLVMWPSLHAQEAIPAQKKADELRALLAETPDLPLAGSAIVIQPPSEGWTLGGRLVSVAANWSGAVTYVLIRADKDHDPILAVDRQGRILRGWGKGLFTIPHNIKIDGDGNIWTTDAGTSKVIKFSPDGRKLLEFVLGDTPTIATGGCAFPASPANGNLDFCGTTDVVVTPDGRVFVTDGYGKKRVLEYSTTGEKRLHEWGGSGPEPGKFMLPHGLAYDGKGVLFVTDRDGGRIERFDTSGTYLGQWSHLGNAGSLKFAGGALWAAIAGPALEASGAQPARRLSYVIKIDPSTGKALGKMETVGTDFIDVTASGEVLAGVTAGGFFRYSPAR